MKDRREAVEDVRLAERSRNENQIDEFCALHAPELVSAVGTPSIVFESPVHVTAGNRRSWWGRDWTAVAGHLDF